MRLALFDLDNTLLPIDSDHAWNRFLCQRNVISADAFKRANDQFYEQYKAGTLNITEYLEFALAPLAAHPVSELNAWHEQFMRELILPAIMPAAVALVESHRSRGDLLCIVTATNEFVTAPIARRFGIDHLIAIEVEQIAGRFTGKSRGVPSFREGKITRVEQWLAGLGFALDHIEDSTFYSDSINDLPLLERVRKPVATNPDPKLAALAKQRGWPIMNLHE